MNTGSSPFVTSQDSDDTGEFVIIPKRHPDSYDSHACEKVLLVISIQNIPEKIEIPDSKLFNFIQPLSVNYMINLTGQQNEHVYTKRFTTDIDLLVDDALINLYRHHGNLDNIDICLDISDRVMYHNELSSYIIEIARQKMGYYDEEHAA